MLGKLYENIGDKIKNLAKWIFIVEAICAVITGVTLLCNEFILEGLLTLACGSIIVWVPSWIFGQIVEDVHAIRNKDDITEEEKGTEKVDAYNKTEVSQEFVDGISPMEEPSDFEFNAAWEKGIAKLSTEKLCKRYLDKGNYTEDYRYMCYLELKKRNEKTAE